jgi:hypothetical protein
MTALGGVATGSMKAYEQLIVPGIMRSRGDCLMATAIEPRMGSTTLAVYGGGGL